MTDQIEALQVLLTEIGDILARVRALQGPPEHVASGLCQCAVVFCGVPYSVYCTKWGREAPAAIQTDPFAGDLSTKDFPTPQSALRQTIILNITKNGYQPTALMLQAIDEVVYAVPRFSIRQDHR